MRLSVIIERMKIIPDYTLLFCDDDIVVLNKKSGLLTAADKNDSDSPRLDVIAQKKLGTLHAVHRIDSGASGIVIYARNREAATFLSRQFAENRAKLTYHALIHSRVLWEKERVSLKLLPDGDSNHRTAVNARYGKACTTTFCNLGAAGAFNWISAVPEIDRVQQIRAHLKSLGLTIVCDSLFGSPSKGVFLSEIKRAWNGDEDKERPLLSRLALHAYSLSIVHPVTAEEMTFVAPYWKDMDALRKQLEKIFGVNPIR